MSQRSIKELRHLLNEIRAENARELDPIAIARLRIRFNKFMAELANAAADSAQFEDRFAKIRGLINLHQLTWGTCRMLDDPDRYRKDSQTIGRNVREFLDWVEQNMMPDKVDRK